MEGSYHRRELKAPCVAFSSPRGRKLFAESLAAGTMEAYFPLAENFVTQGHPSFCGIGSLTMALNSLLVDPKRVWQGVWRWFDESMLDCCAPHDVVKLKGITMSKLQCLARCNGASVHMVLGSDVSLDQFRQHVRLICSGQPVSCLQNDATIENNNGGISTTNNNTVMIVSYHRPKLNQTGSGHFSPIGGYNEAEDMVLIMDVARFKYPPHWAPLTSLYEALQPVDPDSGSSRGYLFIGVGQEMAHHCMCLDTVCVDGAVATTTCDANVSTGSSQVPLPSEPLVQIVDTSSIPVSTENAANPAAPSEDDGNSSSGTAVPICISADSTAAPERLNQLISHSCKSCCKGKKKADGSGCGSPVGVV